MWMFSQPIILVSDAEIARKVMLSTHRGMEHAWEAGMSFVVLVFCFVFFFCYFLLFVVSFCLLDVCCHLRCCVSLVIDCLFDCLIV